LVCRRAGLTSEETKVELNWDARSATKMTTKRTMLSLRVGQRRRRRRKKRRRCSLPALDYMRWDSDFFRENRTRLTRLNFELIRHLPSR